VNESLDSDPGLMVQGALRGLIGSGKILTRAVQRVRSTSLGSSAQDLRAARRIAIPPSWVWLIGDVSNSCPGNSLF